MKPFYKPLVSFRPRSDEFIDCIKKGVNDYTWEQYQFSNSSLGKLTPLFFNLAMVSASIKIANKGLKEIGMLK